MPFTYDLQKKQEAHVYRSDVSSKAKELQALYDHGDTGAYEQKLKLYKSQGHQFRLTDTKVYEVYNDIKETRDVAIRFQVKGNVITWAFHGAPKDETSQEFRDLLYKTAADAHDKVEFGCERYYRGSNAYHVKKMHTYEGESGWNHNHYRRKDGEPITPKEVAEHLRAFIQQPLGEFFFPDPQEVEHLIDIYSRYWADFTYSGPDRPISIKDQYEGEKGQKMKKADLQEEAQHIHEQEPCRIDVADIPTHDIERMRMERMRGIGSELAHTRQVEGSALKQVSEKQVVKMGDREPTHKREQGIFPSLKKPVEKSAAPGPASPPASAKPAVIHNTGKYPGTLFAHKKPPATAAEEPTDDQDHKSRPDDGSGVGF